MGPRLAEMDKQHFVQPTPTNSPTSPSQETPPVSASEHHPLDTWEDVVLGNESFRVKRERMFFTRRSGEDVVFTINEYHHPETNTQIAIWQVGLDTPTENPAIVRADYGCPCMVLGPAFVIPGHDCGPQRSMMFDTLAEVGVGAMAIVSEQTAAGNGHGAHVVFDQATRQHEARINGEEVPSMQQFYSQEGYFPFDKRRHDLVAKALADTVGTERQVIPAMSSQKKIQELADAGLNVIPNTRVEFITNPSAHGDLLRRDNYGQIPQGATQPGAYLVFPGKEGALQHLRLMKDTYDIFAGRATIPAATRRLVN